MMGAMGTTHEMLPYYPQGYNSTFTQLSPNNAICRNTKMEISEAGTYKFTLCGAWAGFMVDQGYDNRDGSNYMDTSSV